MDVVGFSFINTLIVLIFWFATSSQITHDQVSLFPTSVGNYLIWKGLWEWGEGRRKREDVSCDFFFVCVESWFFLMNPNPNYLFQKSLTKGMITNLGLNMHLDSRIYTLLWLWFDVYIRIYFSKVLWEKHYCFCQWARIWECMQIFSRGKLGDRPSHLESYTALITWWLTAL